MNKNSESFFTAGELAALFNIPKQTLLYYDRMGLLSPEFIAENGYRHYSLKQYLTLEVIVNLRKLDIPISRIKEYVENRDIDTFDKLLAAKEKECDEIIEKNFKIKNSLETVFSQLEKIRCSKLNKITLEFQKEKYFFISSLTKTKIGKKRIEIMAHHNQKAFSKQHFKEKNIGWIIKKESFFSSDNANDASAFFSAVGVSHAGVKSCITRPAGFYLTVRFKGTFYNKAVDLASKFKAFAAKNDLQIVGDLYVSPLKNHWITSNPDDYINQISIQVEYK
ncbi:MerR family transcriptional regulator [Phascolarctobacterium sp.]|uniref:MerR family transcriptional regulator n=1 Tax=Phascolarctobacterium sp. TaxID=2049039 RepID=UPI0030787DFD